MKAWEEGCRELHGRGAALTQGRGRQQSDKKVPIGGPLEYSVPQRVICRALGGVEDNFRWIILNIFNSYVLCF